MAETHLTAARLRELLSYDPETGIFTWRVNRGGKALAGTTAGSINPASSGRSRGYVVIGMAGKLHKAHRLAWLYVHGTWPVSEIDHRNRARADNRIANLRDVSQPINMQNQCAARTDSTTHIRGASPLRGKYAAQIFFNGKMHYLGLFKTAEEAGAAYLAAKLLHHPGYMP